MSDRAALHLINDSFGQEAMAFDCGASYLVVGRLPLFARMPKCDSEVRPGTELEWLLRRELDSPRNRHALGRLYRMVGPDMSFAHTPYLTDLMLRHVAHGGGVRAYQFEKIPGGPAEAPEAVRNLVLGAAPGRGAGVGGMSHEDRFHEILLRCDDGMKPGVADQWRRLVAREGLTVMVGSLAVMAGAFVITGAGVPVVLEVGFAATGFTIFKAIGHWTEVFKITRQATTHEDLDRAAYQFARALSTLGPGALLEGVLLGFLTRGATKVTTMLRAAPHRATRSLDPVTGLLRI